MSQSSLPDLPELGERIAQAAHVLIGLDFDGTLTPIVDRPEDAHLSVAMRRRLNSLAGRDRASVAIISGRSLVDLKERVGIPGLIYSGNHGLEIGGPGFRFIEPTAAARSGKLKNLAVDLGQQLRHISGVIIEDKGLSLSVHYRRVSALEREAVWHIVCTLATGASEDFLLRAGIQVYEIRPNPHWHKGSALSWIKRQVGRPDSLVIYLGDDQTDEDAFDSLRDAVTIKVGASAKSAARFLLPGPAEVQAFLDAVDPLLEAERQASPLDIPSGH